MTTRETKTGNFRVIPKLDTIWWLSRISILDLETVLHQSNKQNDFDRFVVLRELDERLCAMQDHLHGKTLEEHVFSTLKMIFHVNKRNCIGTFIL